VSANPTATLAGPSRPLGSPDIPQHFLPAASGTGVFRPRLYGAARIHFADRKRKIDESRKVAFLLPLEGVTKTIDWDNARPTDVMPDQLKSSGPASKGYLPLPAGAMDIQVFTRWAKTFDRWLARTQRLSVAPRGDGGDGPEETSIGPKRGGVSVDLVAIVWELA
jgi:hypothetical protein